MAVLSPSALQHRSNAHPLTLGYGTILQMTTRAPHAQQHLRDLAELRRRADDIDRMPVQGLDINKVS